MSLLYQIITAGILVLLVLVGLWQLLKGAVSLGLVLLLAVAVYVGSFFVVSSVNGDQVKIRTFVAAPLIQVYAPLRLLDLTIYGEDGFRWR